MPNMSYCRFENTYLDLRDCLRALKMGEVDNLSESELKYALSLVGLCEEMLEFEEAMIDIQEQRETEIKEEN